LPRRGGNVTPDFLKTINAVADRNQRRSAETPLRENSREPLQVPGVLIT